MITRARQASHLPIDTGRDQSGQDQKHRREGEACSADTKGAQSQMQDQRSNKMASKR